MPRRGRTKHRADYMSGETCHGWLDYDFQSPALLRQALTHRSYGVPHNERLEFLGDSVLNCAIANLLFHRYPDAPEGELSRFRAHLVNKHFLHRIAESLALGRHVRLGEGELKSGGQVRPSILSDALEAVFGAVFLDGGFDAAEAVIVALYGPYLDRLNPKDFGKDPKTQLQEYLQGHKIPLPQYTVVATRGEAHEQHFEVECLIPQLNIRVRGEGTNRRSAEQAAAKEAYRVACAD